jgi:hypothetical protein
MGFTPVESQLAALHALQHWAEAHDFAGIDPYDALNSPVLALLCMGLKWPRIAAIQGLKRLPLNIRGLLIDRPAHNPKALGLILEGYVRQYSAGRTQGVRRYGDRLLGLLQAQLSPICSGHGWGYNFDWQSRVFFVPRGTPSVVCTSFIGHALLDAWEVLHEQRALELAVPISKFFLHDLNRTSSGDELCFSYTPIDHYAVHNASLLGASLLLRLYAFTGEKNALDASLCALRYTMRRQRDDGCWRYSERPGSHWIDSFHTGFILEAARRFIQSGQALEYSQNYRAGVDYYATRFFLTDGTPKYFNNRVYPIDIHSAAEAISFFSTEPAYKSLTTRVLNWTLANMYDGRGHFYFQRRKAFTIRIPYMRWSQAWMFRALTRYLYQSAPKETPK